MCDQLSLLVIYLLSNGFKYENIVNTLKIDLKILYQLILLAMF